MNDYLAAGAGSRAGDVDGSGVHLYEALDDRQAEAKASVRSVALAVPLVDRREQRGVDSDTGVAD